MSKEITENIRADDFVEYFLFPDLNLLNGQQANEEEILQKFRNDVYKYVEQNAGNYIWHKDPFRLIVRAGHSKLLSDGPQSGDEEGNGKRIGLTFQSVFAQEIDFFFISFIFFFRRIAATLARPVVLW